MIDRDKVFDAFRNCITEPKCKDCPWETCEEFHQTKPIPLDLCLDILKLLKEQEAVEPIPPTDESDLWKCGNCNHQLFRCVDKYCSRCGKAVKWE